MGLIPGGAYRNREFAEKTGVKSSAVLWREDLVFDPQTSGGLLAAVPERDVQEIMKRLEDRGVRMVVDAEKDLLLVEGARHMQSYLLATAEYQERLKRFFAQHDQEKEGGE